MQEFLTQLWAAVGPQVLEAVKAIAAALLAIASAKIIGWANGQKATKQIAEAVVMAEKDAALTTGQEKLAAVMEAVPKAAEAAIEVQVAKLVKCKSVEPGAKECDPK